MTQQKFKYSLISDMHVDFPQPKTPYNLLEENVIVAGDTSNGLLGLKFLQKLENKGFKVFACDGNHEHYANVSQGRTIESTETSFRQSFPTITDIDDKLSIICINGWYQVTSPEAWFGYMNDGRFSVGEDLWEAAKIVNSYSAFHANFLNDMLESFFDRKFIIVTHTAPCIETLDKRFENHYSNEWYWNPFMRQILSEHRDKILVWNHGHTHKSNEAVVDGVRIVCNPRGYPGENLNWEPLTIEVDYD